MTKEEFIGKMQMAYIGDKNALNECTQEYLRLREVIDKVKTYIHVVPYCNAEFDNILDILKEWNK